MTIISALCPRRFPRLEQAPLQERLFEVGEDSKILAKCHWQPDCARRATLLIIHGLEGSADREYVQGTAEKGWQAGFNIVRMNVRNCGGTEHLTPTLYDSGLSRDVGRLAESIVAELNHPSASIFLIGFSMGGNQSLKLVGEMGDRVPGWLKGVVAISPALDLAACAEAIHRGFNQVYEQRFLLTLLRRMKRKARLFPGRFDLSCIRSIRNLRDFDKVFTGPYQGYGTADQYYAKASAIRVAASIRVSTLIIHAKNDPFVPYASFLSPLIRNNPYIRMLTPSHGGHVGFIAARNGSQHEDGYWAENRAVEFCKEIVRKVK